jgi:DNA-binding NarL/FixJ family response regulator
MVNVMSARALEDVGGIDTYEGISVRQLIRDILESYRDIEVVGEAADGEEAVGLAEVCRPNVILMDINLPKKSGVEATRLITQNLTETVVIGISGQYSPHDYNLMMCAGAVAFVRKEDVPELLHKTMLFSLGSYSHRRSPFRVTGTMSHEGPYQS